MGTRKRNIKSRNESISSRKKRSRGNPLQAELDKPLAKSFKQGAAVGATLAGPGKFAKAGKTLKKIITSANKASKAKAAKTAKRLKKNRLQRDKRRDVRGDPGSGEVGIGPALKRKPTRPLKLKKPLQGADVTKNAANKPISRRIDPKEQARLRNMRLKDEKTLADKIKKSKAKAKAKAKNEPMTAAQRRRLEGGGTGPTPSSFGKTGRKIKLK